MRKALSVVALVFALTCSAQAGYMQNGSPEPPPPQPAPAVQGPTTDGEMDTGARPRPQTVTWGTVRQLLSSRQCWPYSHCLNAHASLAVASYPMAA